jgi:exonuclease SbcD
MRVIICGDAHIGAVYGLGETKNGSNTRIDDYEKTLNYIVDYAIQNNVDAFIQTGDVFDSRTPTPEHMNILNKVLRKLSMANITSIVIMGNHDYRRTGEVYTSAIESLAAKDYSNIRLVLSPEIIELHGKDEEKLKVLLLPYRDRRMYGGKTTEEDSLAYQNEALDLLKECNPQFPVIAIGHNFYFDGSYNDYGGTEILVKPEIFNQCDMIAMGHYHQFRIFRRKDPIAFYTGSMEKINFGDENIDKYFLDYNTKNKQTKIIKTPVRQLQDLVLDLSDFGYDNFYIELENQLSNFSLKDKIVRVRLLVKESLVSILSKNDIEKMLYSKDSFYVSKVIIEPILQRLVKDIEVLQHKDELSLFKAFLETQIDMDSEESKEILLEVKRIIEGSQ